MAIDRYKIKRKGRKKVRWVIHFFMDSCTPKCAKDPSFRLGSMDHKHHPMGWIPWENKPVFLKKKNAYLYWGGIIKGTGATLE